jgi:hypothetical protein
MAKTKAKKRKMSAKQKAALKKGQAALKKWRLSRAKKAKTPTKRKRKVVKSKSITRTTNTPIKPKKRTGGSMKKKNAVKRVTRKVQSFARKTKLPEMLQDSAIVIVSGITSGFIVSKLPISDGRIRSMIPIGGGLALAALTGSKNKIAYSIGKGMVILGALSLFKQLAPGVPMLAGERVIILPPEKSSMGRRITFDPKNVNMGRRVKFSGNVSTTGYRTGANT